MNMMHFPSRKSNQNSKKAIKGVVLLLLLLVAASATMVAAKYVKEKQYQAEAYSAGFFVSSDYLTKTGPTYEITESGNTFAIEFYNYEKENVAKISQMDVYYTVEVPSGWSYTVSDENGNNVGQYSGSYILPQSEMATKHILTITHNGESGTVKVHTTKPFAQSILATFIPSGNQIPNYSIHNKGTHCVVKIETNDYAGEITINWDAEICAPDNTNPNMRDWLNSKPSRVFVVQEHTAYELIFFYTSSSTVVESSGSDTTVSLEG